MYVLVDCDLALTLDTTAPDGVVKLDTTVTLPLADDAHVVVLGFGEGDMPRGFEGYDARTVPRFVTNPVFVDVDGDGVWTPPGPRSCATGVESGGRALRRASRGARPVPRVAAVTPRLALRLRTDDALRSMVIHPPVASARAGRAADC